MKIKATLGLHNEFRVERRKAIFREDGTWEPGELVQEAMAYNLILNAGLNACAAAVNMLFTGTNSSFYPRYRFMRSGEETGTGETQRFGSRIFVGSGTGTLLPNRTALFTPLASYLTNFHEREIGSDWASYTQVYTVQPSELVGSNITEVGLGANASNLRTHAMLEDSEGNPISITNKTDTEVVIIYAKVFINLTGFSNDVDVFNGFYNAFLVRVYNNTYATEVDFDLGRSGNPTNPDVNFADRVASLSRITEFTPTITYPSTGVTKYAVRIATAEANEKIKEIGISQFYSSNRGEFPLDISSVGGSPGYFRALLADISQWTGHTITDELIGTGDDSETIFTADWNEWNTDAVTVKVNGATVTTGFTIDRTAGTVTFDSPVATGETVKVTYGVDYIPKDSNHVLDITWEFHFTDANAV